MSRRASKSAVFIAGLASNPKGKYNKEVLSKTDLKRRELQNSPSSPPVGFKAEISFYSKSQLSKLTSPALVTYFNDLLRKYEDLELIIKKPIINDVFQKSIFNLKSKPSKLTQCIGN